MGKRQGSRNRVRIIGGEHGGRSIAFDDGPGLRPTGDRVRETLFNWLQADIPGARCLDLFAGSGALGFEAVSRGAKEAWLLEKSPRAVERLEANCRILGLSERIRVINTDALRWLARADAQPFDIVFVDPPYDKRWVPQVLDSLAGFGWVGAHSKVYVEEDQHDSQGELPPGWTQLRHKIAGQVSYGLLSWTPDEA